MRVDSEQREQILAVVREYLVGRIFKLYLYGSRVNDQLKGGDIDLLIDVETETQMTEVCNASILKDAVFLGGQAE